MHQPFWCTSDVPFYNEHKSVLEYIVCINIMSEVCLYLWRGRHWYHIILFNSTWQKGGKWLRMKEYHKLWMERMEIPSRYHRYQNATWLGKGNRVKKVQAPLLPCIFSNHHGCPGGQQCGTIFMGMSNCITFCMYAGFNISLTVITKLTLIQWLYK